MKPRVLPGAIVMLMAFLLSWHPDTGRAAESLPLASASGRIERAFLHGDTAALTRIAASLDGSRGRTGASAKYADYYAGYANYALARLCSGHDDDKADRHIDAAEEALQRALDADADFAEAHALLASSYGLEIGMHPLRGMWLGRRADTHMDRATRLAPQNPRVILLRAINAWHAPARFGGSRQQAAEGFAEAIAAFDRAGSALALAPSWGEAEAHAWRARAEADAGAIDAARRDDRAALEKEPGYAEARAGLARLSATPPSPGR